MTYLAIFLLIAILFPTPAQKQITNNKKLIFMIRTDNKYHTKSLNGLYYAVKHRFNKQDFDYGGRYDVFFTFYPDGRVFQGSATEGTDAFDPNNTSVNGHYQVQGNVVYINWVDGNKLSSPIAKDGSLTFYDYQYRPLPNCNGMTLDGVYGRYWNHDSTERRVILFTPDGKFQDTGVLPQTSLLSSYKYLHTTPLWSNDNPLIGVGNYAIRNNTLYLDYGHGIIETIQIYIRPEHMGVIPFTQIMLGGWEFELKKL